MAWNFFKKEKRSEIVQSDNVAGGTILSWLKLGELGALNISTFNRGVQLISSAIAQLPIYTKKINGKGESNILKNHPTNLLWKDTTNLVDKVTMIRTLVQNVITKGNAYLYIQRAADGTPISLRYLHPQDVQTYYNKNTNVLYYTCSLVTTAHIYPKDMLHFKMWTWDGINGISLMSFAHHAVDITNATNEQAKQYFENGCSNMNGILTVNSQLSDKQRQQILNTWQSSYSNSKAALTVLQGNMTYQNLNNNPDDSQLLDSRKYNAADVCQYLNISPGILGIEGYSTYSSFEDANNELLTRTLMPYICMIEAELSRKLLTESEQKNVKIILDTSQYLRANKQSEASYYTALVGAGILSINEVRKALGYNEIENCDVPIIPYTKIEDNQVTNQGQDNNENNTTEDDGEGNKNASITAKG